MDFNLIFDRVIGHEAGFTDNPDDPGNYTKSGELKGTKYGIAANTYPDIDIKNLTIEQARAIYFEDWYSANGIQRFTPAMQFQMFDAAFNHGMKNASKIFQRAVGVKDDGYIGPITMEIASYYTDSQLVDRFLSKRIAFYTSLKTFETFGKGWMNRVSSNLMYASDDIGVE